MRGRYGGKCACHRQPPRLRLRNGATAVRHPFEKCTRARLLQLHCLRLVETGVQVGQALVQGGGLAFEVGDGAVALRAAGDRGGGAAQGRQLAGAEPQAVSLELHSILFTQASWLQATGTRGEAGACCLTRSAHRRFHKLVANERVPSTLSRAGAVTAIRLGAEDSVGNIAAGACRGSRGLQARGMSIDGYLKDSGARH